MSCAVERRCETEELLRYPPILVALLVGGAAAAGAALVEPGEAATDPLEPDIVVADARLPGGSGIALLEGARRLRPPLSVILMSADPTVSEEVRAMQLGAESYLAKSAAGVVATPSPGIIEANRARCSGVTAESKVLIVASF